MTRPDRPHRRNPHLAVGARNICRFESVPLIVMGPGRLSLDHLLGIEPSEATSERARAYAT